jgi:hypothetical protein
MSKDFPEMEYKPVADAIELPNDATPLDFLEAVYRSSTQPIYQRMKAAIEAAQYRHPRLAMTATISEGGIAEMLDKAIARSGVKLTIEHRQDEGAKPAPAPIPPHGTERVGPTPDRRFRRG